MDGFIDGKALELYKKWAKGLYNVHDLERRLRDAVDKSEITWDDAWTTLVYVAQCYEKMK